MSLFYHFKVLPARMFSQTIREAYAMHRHFERLFNSQRDLLTPEGAAEMQARLDDVRGAVARWDRELSRTRLAELSAAADRWIQLYPQAGARENVEILLVALVVALGIRTFFLQPFKIPTGSMQPTLFGVTSVPDFSQDKIDYWAADRHLLYYRPADYHPELVAAELKEQTKLRDNLIIPTGWNRVKEWFAGNRYIHLVALTDGPLDSIDPPVHVLINIKQRLWINGVAHTIWFPPDCGEQPLEMRAALSWQPDHIFHKGEDIIRMKVSAGDHLLVDRMSYNFRKPARGEITVFSTQGTAIKNQDDYYVKRLMVLPGEHVQIGDDRHLRIDGERLDASTPHFANVYGFDPATPPHESEYSGHVNGTVARKFHLYPDLAPKFPRQSTIFTNRPDAYLFMGDNTCNSSDSRTWGMCPVQNVIGKAFMVYWPLTHRFGWNLDKVVKPARNGEVQPQMEADGRR